MTAKAGKVYCIPIQYASWHYILQYIYVLYTQVGAYMSFTVQISPVLRIQTFFADPDPTLQ